MRILLSSILILLAATSVLAQDGGLTITGSIADSASGERLPYASVLVEGTSIGTVADVNGYFILRRLRLTEPKLRISAVGYTVKVVDVLYSGKPTISLSVFLSASPSTLPNVEVMGRALKGAAGIAGTTVITPRQLQNSVNIFGTDAVQYLTQLPGVVTVSGVSSQYYVRGGGPDENLVLVDGMPVYNLSHAFGLFSFIDPVLVKVASFSVGGFQAEYGGRLSSVLDIRTIDGDKNRYRAQGTIDLLSSDILLTGPVFSRGSGSFVAFYRRPLFQNALQKFYSLALPFTYYDGFGKVAFDFSPNGHLSGEFLISSDQINQKSQLEPDFRWTNKSGAVSGGFIAGDQFDLRFSLCYSEYRSEQLPKESRTLGYQFDDISNVSLYGEVVSYTSSRDQVTVGLDFSFPSYNYTFTNRYGARIEEIVSEVEPQLWAKYNFRPNGRFSFEAGLRADMQRTFQSLVGTSHAYFAEPRLTLSYKFSEPFTLYANFGTYHQRLMDLNDENLVFTPFDLLAPVPDSSGDEESIQYILGCRLEPNNLTSVRIEVYYKNLSRLAAVNLNKVFEWESDYVFGKGRAYGADVSVRYDAGPALYFFLGYSYGNTIRVLDGTEYYPRYDLRNQMNLSAGFSPLKKFWIRGRLKLTSGLPYTPIDGYFGVIQSDPVHLPAYTNQGVNSQPLFGDMNSAPLPGYQSLDFSASYELDLDWAHFNLQGSVINVLNKRNVFYMNNVTGEVVYQLPVLFNFSLGWNI